VDRSRPRLRLKVSVWIHFRGC